MKKMLMTLMVAGLMFSLTACQSIANSFGGDITITLEPGQKLELITWKGDNLWYCTRPMRPEETPEVHTYEESTNFGVLEGTVTIVEQEPADD